MACKGCGNNSNGSTGKGKIAGTVYDDDVNEKYQAAGSNELIIKENVALSKRIKVTSKMRREFVGDRNYTIKKRVSTIDNRLIWFMLNHGQYEKMVDLDKMMASNVTAVSISTKAKALAEENNIDISTVEGTGKNGSITLTDIKRTI